LKEKLKVEEFRKRIAEWYEVHDDKDLPWRRTRNGWTTSRQRSCLEPAGSPEPLLDRNMIRVLERVFGVRSARKRPHTNSAMWSFTRMLIPILSSAPYRGSRFFSSRRSISFLFQKSGLNAYQRLKALKSE